MFQWKLNGPRRSPCRSAIHNVVRTKAVNCLVVAVLVLLPVVGSAPLNAQVSGSGLRPFVMGWIPVVGQRGQVGGVTIDAKGVIRLSDSARAPLLASARARAIDSEKSPALQALATKSPLRKVSLKGLQQTIVDRIQAGKSVGEDIQLLAGLQRIEFVFLDPDGQDLILAGPAEGWIAGPQGTFVGRTTGLPVLQLDDLVVALRWAKQEDAPPISCSIDPTEAGLRRLQAALPRGNRRRLASALGNQQVTIAGIDERTHFARVLVGADVQLKRVAMNLEAKRQLPINSYLQRLAATGQGVGSSHYLPRWWLEMDYAGIERDELGLTWRLKGRGMKAYTENAHIDRQQAGNAAPVDPIAQAWAAEFNRRLPELATAYPVLAQLQGCMDLALVAALFEHAELRELADCPLTLLTEPLPMKVVSYPAPKSIPTQVGVVRVGQAVLVALSGGVDLKSSRYLEKIAEVPALQRVRTRHLQARRRWWWD